MSDIYYKKIKPKNIDSNVMGAILGKGFQFIEDKREFRKEYNQFTFSIDVRKKIHLTIKCADVPNHEKSFKFNHVVEALNCVSRIESGETSIEFTIFDNENYRLLSFVFLLLTIAVFLTILIYKAFEIFEVKKIYQDLTCLFLIILSLAPYYKNKFRKLFKKRI